MALHPIAAKFRSCGRDHDYRHRLQQQSVAAEAIARSVVAAPYGEARNTGCLLLPERDRFLEQRVVGYQNSVCDGSVNRTEQFGITANMRKSPPIATEVLAAVFFALIAAHRFF